VFKKTLKTNVSRAAEKFKWAGDSLGANR